MEQEIIIWNNCVALLISSHVQISNEDDQLVWSYSKTGKYTPKASYFYLIEDRNDLDWSWWWKWLWKQNCPLKSKLYCWFLFSGKALTWDILCRRGRVGPGRCYLCKLEAETNDHIGFECSFTRTSLVRDR